MALPPALVGALLLSGAAAVASILLFYAAYYRNSTLELRKARLFLRYRCFETSFVIVAFMALGATLLLLATLAVAPEAIDDLPDVPILLVIIVPLCAGYVYSYYVGRGKEPPLLAYLRKRRLEKG
ncbi:MAG: hypothetical protein QXO51_07230 [Halobacteria archaeon]